MKKTPIRKDVVSGARYPQKELRRFVIVAGKLVYDASQSLPGRGYYLRPGSDPKKAEKAFARLLRRELASEETDALRA